MTKFVISLASAMGLLLAGCAGMGSANNGELVASDEAIRESTKQAQPEKDPVYLILAAELAGQRGQYEVALDNYLKAAELTKDVKVLQRATQIALYLKKNDKALEAASLWQQQEPNNAEARRLAAFLLLKAGRTDEALEQMTALLNMPGIDLENTMIDLVKLLGSEESKDDGFKLLGKLSERFPRMAEVHFAYALLAADQGEYQLALSETEKALSQHPSWSRARMLQAQLMAKMGDSQKAREVIQKAVQSDPKNLWLRLIYAQYLAKAGDLRKAEAELQKILAKESNNADAMLALAMVQMDLGQDAKARQVLERLTESPARKMQAYFYLGLIEAKQNRLQESLRWFDKVTEGPSVFDAKVNAITALIALKQIPEARRRLVEVRKSYPQEALRLYLLEAELLNKSKQYSESFDILTQALEEMPGQTELLYTRALVAEQMDRVDVLEADLRAVLEKNPNDANALNALGFTLADRSQRLDEAKGYIAKALELKPDDPAILDSYGWVNYRLGNLSVALEYLKRAYGLLKDPEIGAHYGEVLWESGQRKEAKKVWMESLRKSPDSDDMKKIKERYPEAFK